MLLPDKEAEAEESVILEAEGDAKEIYKARKAAETSAARQKAARTQALLPSSESVCCTAYTLLQPNFRAVGKTTSIVSETEPGV